MLHIYLSNTPTQKKPGAAGKRVRGYEVKLTDAAGRDTADGEEGVLWVRGDSNAPCYWNRPDKTAETMREGGWIYTGDRFVRDADGFHFFRGRADDLVKVSGQWVYPLEVELCLAEHPSVRECAVLAVEQANGLTALKAFVVLADPAAVSDETTRALQDFVKGRLLPYKYPRLISYVSELPKTGTGKIDRQALIKQSILDGIILRAKFPLKVARRETRRYDARRTDGTMYANFAVGRIAWTDAASSPAPRPQQQRSLRGRRGRRRFIPRARSPSSIRFPPAVQPTSSPGRWPPCWSRSSSSRW